MNLEIGQKVTWNAGRPKRPIVNKGLYLGPSEKEKDMSTIIMYKSKGLTCRLQLDVVTDLLELDDE